MKTNETLFDTAAKMNNATYNAYYSRLRQLAISMFEWKGLPDSCDARFLERVLFMYGRAIFIKDDELGFLNLKCTPGGNLNVYEIPVAWTAWSINYNKQYDNDNCVIIRNNYDEIPTDFIIQLYAKRFYEVERTMDVNIKQQKTPLIVRCDEKQRLTLQNLYMKYEGNEPFIFGDKNLDLEGVKVLKTDAPFIADKLMQYKHDLWNDALTFLGLNNANTDKKERLIVSEAESNNEFINMSAETMLKTRQIAAELINKRYGLNVSVELKRFNENEIDEPKEEPKKEEQKEGEENE